MTPTLLGRWQTRVVLMFSVGLAICVAWGVRQRDMQTPVTLWAYVLVLGLGWDVLYQYLQGFRWDRDWPPLFQLIGGALEGLTIWAMVSAAGFWALFGRLAPPGVSPGLERDDFVTHYGLVWLSLFLITLGPIKLLNPRWRFRGGEWW